jgi:energy-coupling factor transport system ATP-binding protein
MDNLKERVRNAMAQVGLDFEKFKDHRLTTLSGGEKRKVAIASTLILDQDILLFDEPTAGMDPHSRDELIALFRKLNRQGKTIVIASHRLEELAAITETSSVMKSGKVIASAESAVLFSDQSLLNSAGLEPPFGAVIVQALIKKGWPLDLRDPVISSNPGKLVEILSK